MKIGGLTWWRNNYGSILQAYALQKQIQQIPGIEYEIINQFGKKITSVDNLKDKIAKIGFYRSLKRAFWKFSLPKLRNRVRNIQNFIDTHLNVSTIVYNQDTIRNANNVYTGFVCGSDQIWNPSLSEVGNMYWLPFANKDKIKVAYAPSIGGAQIDRQTENQMRALLKNFDAISCRENSGTQIINSILNEQKCVTVLDPTLLMDASEWDEVASDKKYNNDYIFVYMLRGTKKQRLMIEKFAREKQMPIVSIPILDPDCIELYDLWFGENKCWDASPADFISLIKNASFVFGDSFHAMVFSCIYHVPFFLFPKISEKKVMDDSQMNRMVDFQDMLGIKGRIIDLNTSVNGLINVPEIDWVTVDSVLAEKREKSKKYLVKSLGGIIDG